MNREGQSYENTVYYFVKTERMLELHMACLHVVLFPTFFSFKFWANVQFILVQLELIHIYQYKLDIAKVYLSFHCSSTLSRLFWRNYGFIWGQYVFLIAKGLITWWPDYFIHQCWIKSPKHWIFHHVDSINRSFEYPVSTKFHAEMEK